MESKKVKYPLGALSSIEALTFGQPGQRTFKVDLQAGSAFCSVWMEKEQLFQLAAHLKEATSAMAAEDKARLGEPNEPAWSSGEATIEFKAGQLMLSLESESNRFYVQAHEREDEETDSENQESVSFSITVDQAVAFAEESLRICAAGRPSCFLCGQPINPEGHVCPRANGHTVLEAG